MCAPIVGIPSTLRDTISELTSNICTMERIHGGLWVESPSSKRGFRMGDKRPGPVDLNPDLCTNMQDIRLQPDGACWDHCRS